MNHRNKLVAAAAAITLIGVAPLLIAQEKKTEPAQIAQQTQPYRPGGGYGPGYGMGPGMMGGGPGYGSGYGMGPGMMGGRGGYGMGPGMMGGDGMGSGMMGRMGAIWSFDLSEEQAGRIDRIQDELQRKHRGLMTQMWEAQGRLRDFYVADSRDAAAMGKAYAQVNDLQRQMFESRVQAEKQMEEVLTTEQRAQLRRDFRRGGSYNYCW